MSDNKQQKPIKVPRTVEQEIRRRTIFSFTVFFVLIVAGIFAWKWFISRPEVDGVASPLRRGFRANAKVFGAAYSTKHLAKEYPVSAAVKDVRVNGDAGMGDDFDTATWKLKVVRNPNDTLFLTLNDIKSLPKKEVVFDFKCIEGWSQVTHWGGARFSDFIEKYHLDPQAALKYVGLVTPDSEYYVGIDMESMMQPQTILCYEMNGKPLPFDQGYPLRLIIPVKYGIKHLKRIGTMFFSNQKPKDYWAERGYDYYSGL